MPAIEAHERLLTAYALPRLREIPGVTVHGPQSLEERVKARTLELSEANRALREEIAERVRGGGEAARHAHVRFSGEGKLNRL